MRKSFFLLATAVLILGMHAVLPTRARAADGDVDATCIIPLINDYVVSTGLQSDGKMIIAGGFTTIDGATTSAAYMARLNADCTHDTTFNIGGAGVNGAVRDIEVLADDSILVAGSSFTTYNGVMARKIIKLNADGTLNTSFAAAVGTGFSSDTYSMAVDSLGRAIFTGDFTAFNGVSTGARLARINADGTLDTVFSANLGTGFSGRTGVVTIQPDGKILVSGQFGTFNGTSTPNHIVRLNADGTLDSSFYLGTTNTPQTGFTNALLVLPDDKILYAPYSSAAYDGVSSTTASSSVVLLNANGTRDMSFPPGSGFNIFTPRHEQLAYDSTNGKILIGSTFASYNGTPAGSLARLNSDGTLDSTFDVGSGFAGPSLIVYSVLIDEVRQKLWVAGRFASYDGQNYTHLVRLEYGSAVTPVISSISTVDISASSARISWLTQIAADSKIEYGTISGSYGSEVFSAQATTSHSLSLSGLQPSATYHYRVISQVQGEAATSSEGSFVTLSGGTAEDIRNTYRPFR